MSKYEPLNHYLKSQLRSHVPMTFAEIEQVLGTELPHSKMHRAWWSNNPSNNVMTKEWLSAGYETESVDVATGRLVFRKIKRAVSSHENPVSGAHKRSSIFGCMKGTLTFNDSLDLTRPVDPVWGKAYEDG